MKNDELVIMGIYPHESQDLVSVVVISNDGNIQVRSVKQYEGLEAVNFLDDLKNRPLWSYVDAFVIFENLRLKEIISKLEPENKTIIPVESLLVGLIIVAKPISCIVRNVPSPVLALFVLSPKNDRHSGPESISFSSITKAHLPQIISPVSASVTIASLPHLGHLSLVLIWWVILSFRFNHTHFC